ncbi:MAG TPA: hypothetical protein VFO40_21315, partial [Chthoniobacterales bacterium]|nr:hypothetical protein [Chthoniobacterales bacterium]
MFSNGKTAILFAKPAASDLYGAVWCAARSWPAKNQTAAQIAMTAPARAAAMIRRDRFDDVVRLGRIFLSSADSAASSRSAGLDQESLHPLGEGAQMLLQRRSGRIKPMHGCEEIRQAIPWCDSLDPERNHCQTHGKARATSRPTCSDPLA